MRKYLKKICKTQQSFMYVQLFVHLVNSWTHLLSDIPNKQSKYGSDLVYFYHSSLRNPTPFYPTSNFRARRDYDFLYHNSGLTELLDVQS